MKYVKAEVKNKLVSAHLKFSADQTHVLGADLGALAVQRILHPPKLKVCSHNLFWNNKVNAAIKSI